MASVPDTLHNTVHLPCHPRWLCFVSSGTASTRASSFHSCTNQLVPSRLDGLRCRIRVHVDWAPTSVCPPFPLEGLEPDSTRKKPVRERELKGTCRESSIERFDGDGGGAQRRAAKRSGEALPLAREVRSRRARHSWNACHGRIGATATTWRTVAMVGPSDRTGRALEVRSTRT